MARFPRLSPFAIEMFCGKYPAKLRFPESLVAGLPASPLHGMPPSDVRDWTAIHAWANSLVTKFQVALPQ
jgi:menaquinone-dependent protoporphyrinogen oxidase